MTLGEFARRYRRERSEFPTLLRIGEITCKGVGLNWILEDRNFDALLDAPIYKFVNCKYGPTAIVIKGAAS